MKSEQPDLALTIANLARAAAPVTPLDAPSVRLARWAVLSAALALASIVGFGVRPDLAAQLTDGWFVARAAATLSIVAAAAFVALTDVPGVEPSRAIRALPLAAGLIWALTLSGRIAAARAPLDVLLQAAPHPSCVVLIAAIAFLPGVAFARMVWKTAPLGARRTGGLAALASLAVGALGAQFVCGDDAAAHQLLWHLTPVGLLALAITAAASPVLDRSHRRRF